MTFAGGIRKVHDASEPLGPYCGRGLPTQWRVAAGTGMAGFLARYPLQYQQVEKKASNFAEQ